jgi:hypothetical protein
MKIAIPKDVTPKEVAILPLSGTTSDEVGKYNSKSFDLLVDPVLGAGHATYRQNYRILKGDEDLRTKIQWIKDVKEVLAGLLATTLAPQRAIVKTLTNQATYAQFGQAMTELAAERYAREMTLAETADTANGNHNLAAALQLRGHQQDVLDVPQALVDTIEANLPYKCLSKVKRFMRRECRKPLHMKAREYVNAIMRVNNEEVPFIPPGAVGQQLSEDEILDIILYGTPKSWSTEMTLQGFHPLDNSVAAVVDFMERVEETELVESKRNKKPSSNSNGNQKPAAKDWKTKDWKVQGKGGTKYCSLHGRGSHSTEECHTVQNKRFKNDRNNNPGYQKKAHGNKTWTKNADDGKRESKKELNAIVKKAIAKGVRKELNSIQAKRKTDDSSDDEGELHMLEAFDLKDFNYADMENLKIKAEDEVSV